MRYARFVEGAGVDINRFLRVERDVVFHADHLVLRSGGFMIRQQFDALEGACAPEQGRRPLEMRVAVVYAGNDGQPDDERLRAFESMRAWRRMGALSTPVHLRCAALSTSLISIITRSIFAITSAKTSSEQ